MTRSIAVVGVSRKGARLAGRIAQGLPDASLWVPADRMEDAPAARPFSEPVSDLLPRLFLDPSIDALVVVLALGATVRLLAPHLRAKQTDPAVVVLDDAGCFAIPLLGGHAAGANDLARHIAGLVGACPVITTASDLAGLPAVDTLAEEHGWRLEASPLALRRAAAALVNGESVAVLQDAGSPGWLPDPLPPSLHVLDSKDAMAERAYAACLLVSDRCHDMRLFPDATVVYRPATLVAGVGCSTDATAADLRDVLERAVSSAGLAPASIACLATIDRRAAHPAVLALTHDLDLPVRAFPAARLAEVPDVPHPSEVVRAAVGTPGVCEPAALLASGAAHLLVTKVRGPRATAAIARRVVA